jgi:RNA polymerase sigma-70 factor (ECF subfamily)
MTTPARVTSLETDPSDQALIAGVLSGDEQSFRLLYRRHAPRLRRVVARLLGPVDADTDDTVQESWVRAVKQLATFRGDSTLSTWLCAIAVRVSRESIRRRTRQRIVAIDAAGEHAVRPMHLSERVDLEAAIAELPEQARAVVVLHDIEGFTHEEIARHFGIATGTSKSQLSRARELLRRRLGGSIS